MKATIAILIVMGICLLTVSLLILGEFIAGKFKKSSFFKWWRKNVIMEVDDHYPG